MVDYLIFANTGAGRGDASLIGRRIMTLLQEAGKQALMVSFLSKDDMERELPKFALDVRKAIVVIGGDGTVNAVVNAFNGILPVPLFIIPGGTGNDFYRMVYGGIHSLEKQVKSLLNGKVVRVDAGRSNGNFFVNCCGIGFEGVVAHDLQSKKFLLRGLFAYLASVLYRMFFYKPLSYVVEYDGVRRKGSFYILTFGNG